MTLIEIIVVYLAVGAPFGAVYYLQQRKHFAGKKLWLAALAACLLWVFYAAFVLSRKINFRQPANLIDARQQSEIEVGRTVQNLLTANNRLIGQISSQSFFEFRETLERYAGLTLAVNNSAADARASEREAEIFVVAKRPKKDARLGARLVHRRNFNRLQIHQTQARLDLARLVEGLAKIENQIYLPEFRQQLLKLASILGDAEAVGLFERALRIEQPQFDRAHTERFDQPEQRIWKTETSPTTAF